MARGERETPGEETARKTHFLHTALRQRAMVVLYHRCRRATPEGDGTSLVRVVPGNYYKVQ